jgi:hypothetical protein
MANPPPPFANVSGIARADMKYNSQETIQNYDGNFARPGELVVDLNTFDLYVGNSNGNLNLVGGGSGNAGYPQSGGTFYVDVGRTDYYTATGTIEAPFKTLQSALNAASANTTINLAPGVYTENIVMPDLDGICINGGSEMNTKIQNATAGHTIYWYPAASTGANVHKFCLSNLEITNSDNTGTYHALHIDATRVTYPNTFIDDEFDMVTVDFDGNQTQANAIVYLNNVGTQLLWHSQISGGALTVINPGEFRSTGIVIGNTADPHDFNVTYDGNLPRNGLGRNDITLAAGSAVFGNVTLNGHPLYQEDVDSVVVGTLNGGNLSSFYASGRDYCPIILAYGQHGTVGGNNGNITITFPDPQTSGSAFNFVDFSGAHVLGTVSLSKANLLPLSARGYAVVQGQGQFDTTAAGGITANGYVALDLRTAGYNANSLAVTGAATVDRSVIAIANTAVTTAGTVISITPPLPTGATYAASVTPLSVATTAYVSNKNTGNVKVTVAANCSVDLTLHRT